MQEVRRTEKRDRGQARVKSRERQGWEGGGRERGRGEAKGEN